MHSCALWHSIACLELGHIHHAGPLHASSATSMTVSIVPEVSWVASFDSCWLRFCCVLRLCIPMDACTHHHTTHDSLFCTLLYSDAPCWMYRGHQQLHPHTPPVYFVTFPREHSHGFPCPGCPHALPLYGVDRVARAPRGMEGSTNGPALHRL